MWSILQPSYNTVIYSTNSVLTQVRFGFHCLYSLYISSDVSVIEYNFVSISIQLWAEVLQFHFNYHFSMYFHFGFTSKVIQFHSCFINISVSISISVESWLHIWWERAQFKTAQEISAGCWKVQACKQGLQGRRKQADRKCECIQGETWSSLEKRVDVFISIIFSYLLMAIHGVNWLRGWFHENPGKFNL